MNNFDYAFKVLMSWEGGYSQTSGDPGGETYCGISRHFHPDWQGWEVVDVNKPMHFNQVLPNLQSVVEGFYLLNYWNMSNYPMVISDEVAAKIFQHDVNMGKRAVELIQNEYHIPVDGFLGILTVNKINEVSDILPTYCSILQGYYRNLVLVHPQLSKFEHEWLLRARTIGVRP